MLLTYYKIQYTTNILIIHYKIQYTTNMLQDRRPRDAHGREII